MFTRLPFTVRLGLELIVAAIALAGGFARWDHTRSWEPLNQPVSLARGHMAAYGVIYRWGASDSFLLSLLLLWICAGVAGSGGTLLAIAGAGRFRRPHPAVAPGIAPGGIRGSVRLFRKPARVLPFSGLSYFGKIAALFYTVLFLTFWFVTADAHIGPVGLTVHLMRPRVMGEPSPGLQPIQVRVTLRGSSKAPDVYLDSRRVSWDDLPLVLRAELSRRPPNWPVYVEGDPNMNYGFAVKAVDAARGLGANVVLVAPNARPSPRPKRDASEPK